MRIEPTAYVLRPKEWLWDMALRHCSLSARGLYADLLCMMQEGEPCGHLTARMSLVLGFVGLLESEYGALLAELEGAGILARTDDGVLYAPRLIQQTSTRAKLAANGTKGGRPPRKES